MVESNARPAIAKSPLSVILLADCAEEARAGCIAAWQRFLQDKQIPYELILVEEVAHDAAGASPPLVPIQDAKRVWVAFGSGAGTLLRAGMAAATCPLVFYTRLAEPFEPHDLQKLLDLIDQVDLVTGYRVQGQAPAWYRWVGGVWRGLVWLFLGLTVEPCEGRVRGPGWGRRLLARWIFGVRVHDPACVFRLCRRDSLQRIVLQCEGPFVHEELLAKANFLGLWMTEAPVSWNPEAGARGGQKASQSPCTCREIWELFRRPTFSVQAGASELANEHSAAAPAPRPG